MLDTTHTNPTVVPYRLQTLQLFPRSCGLPEGAWSAEYSIKHDYSTECSIQYLQTLQLFPTTYKPYSCSHAAENHYDSGQVRVETYSAPLKVRGVQNT